MTTQNFRAGLDRNNGTDRAQTTPTVLLVDDDALVRTGVAGLLDALQFAVIEAASATEALACLASNRQIDLLITDHLMPGMSGLDLVRQARHAYPNVPAILMSGYTSLTKSAVNDTVLRLEKPFRMESLRQAIADVFNDLPATRPT